MTAASWWLQLLPALAGESESPATDGRMFGGINPTMLLLFAGLIIVMFVIARMRKRAAESARPGAPAAGPSGAAAREQAARESVERLAVDLEETARSVAALLDAKIHVLDKLIRDADARIAKLSALEGRSPPAAAADPYAASPAPPAPEVRSAADETIAHHARIFGLADQGLSVPQIAEETGCQRGEVELILSLRKIGRPGG